MTCATAEEVKRALVSPSYVEATGFGALAIAKYDDKASGVQLFYCDRSWNVVTDT